YNTATVAADDGSVPEDMFGGDQQSGAGVSGMFRTVRNPNLPKTEFGWEIDPVGFRATLREIDSRYHLPMLITENGLGAYDEISADGKVHDPYRIKYLKDHIEQMQEAITDGVSMLGYNPWSAIDLISTHEGMRKRYGFIYVDRDEFDLGTMKRIPKDSFYWYKKVIASNGDDLSE
ncbi:MAG: family 1 glycosylhydrolase, partial [Allobaculum sp.]|nr:family 1 glycosylhydrolase [Allobaculum sp.]